MKHTLAEAQFKRLRFGTKAIKNTKTDINHNFCGRQFLLPVLFLPCWC